MKKFKAIVALLLACSLLAIFIPAVSAEGVVFADPNFEAAVRNYLKLTGPIDAATLAGIQYLGVSSSDIGNFSDLKYFPGLVELWIDGNKATSVDVSKMTKLQTLDVSWCGLTSLDVSQNTALMQLISFKNKLTTLDVSKNTALTYLDFGFNAIVSLDVSKNQALLTLICGGNPISALDVSNNKNIKYLTCDNNQLTSLDVSKNTDLYELYCNNNQLTSLDVSKNTGLFNLDCYDNQLSALDVSKNTALYDLDCFQNQLTSLDVSQNTALTGLNCANNQITALNLAKNTALFDLYCGENKLTSLVCPYSIKWVDAHSNNLTAFAAPVDTYGYLNLANNPIAAPQSLKDAPIGMLILQENGKNHTYINDSYDNIVGEIVVDGKAYAEIFPTNVSAQIRVYNMAPPNIPVFVNASGISGFSFQNGDPNSGCFFYNADVTANPIYVEITTGPVKPGDVNFDGEIDTVDARMILQWIVGKTSFLGAQATAADVNADSKVDTVDARLILQYIVGKIKTFT